MACCNSELIGFELCSLLVYRVLLVFGQSVIEEVGACTCLKYEQ